MIDRPTSGPDLRWAWGGALGCFVLAGATGALYRFGIGYGMTAGLDLVDIRHAHSHLMYFGWVTPALMALIGSLLPSVAGRAAAAGMRGLLAATFAAALLAYPPFLAYGYAPVEIGGSRLPLSVIAASLNMLVWYGFVFLYVRTTRGVPRTRALLLWDLALTFLGLATLGAWGLGLSKPLGIESPAVTVGLTHIFLDLFSEGWFVLAVLGLAYAVLDARERPAGHWSIGLIGLGLPATFALAMPASLVAPPLKVLAGIGGTLVAAGLLANVWILVKASSGREGWLWRIPLLLLGLKALAQLAACLVPGVWWASQHGLRILYLHLMLLGFVSLGLVAAATFVWGRRATWGKGAFYAAVLLLLASLLPLTVFWPAAWGGRWAFLLAAWVALAPVLAAAAMLGAGSAKLRVRVLAAGARLMHLTGATRAPAAQRQLPPAEPAAEDTRRRPAEVG